ncbi:MAG: HPr family phosphocarrier protein [Eubacteriales bacterium]|nr:HPr family phosphocarrier protein [Eubacteriales bacterium]
MNIYLHSVKDVTEFVNEISKVEGAATIYAGRYIINAKSIMGIFSLDLSEPLKLEIENWKEEYAPRLEKYLAE